MKKFPIYCEWVQTLMDYNNELIGIIDKVHTNADTKATHDNHRSLVPMLPLPLSSSPVTVAVDKHNLIDFDNCQYEHVQSTETTSSTMAYEGIVQQNVRILFQLDKSFSSVSYQF